LDPERVHARHIALVPGIGSTPTQRQKVIATAAINSATNSNAVGVVSITRW